MGHNSQAVKVGGSGLHGRHFTTFSFSGILQAFWDANVLCLNTWCIQVCSSPHIPVDGKGKRVGILRSLEMHHKENRSSQ